MDVDHELGIYTEIAERKTHLLVMVSSHAEQFPSIENNTTFGN